MNSPSPIIYSFIPSFISFSFLLACTTSNASLPFSFLHFLIHGDTLTPSFSFPRFLIIRQTDSQILTQILSLCVFLPSTFSGLASAFHCIVLFRITAYEGLHIYYLNSLLFLHFYTYLRPPSFTFHRSYFSFPILPEQIKNTCIFTHMSMKN